MIYHTTPEQYKYVFHHRKFRKVEQKRGPLNLLPVSVFLFLIGVRFRCNLRIVRFFIYLLLLRRIPHCL